MFINYDIGSKKRQPEENPAAVFKDKEIKKGLFSVPFS